LQKFILLLISVFVILPIHANKVSKDEGSKLIGYAKIRGVPAVSDKIIKTIKQLQTNQTCETFLFWALTPFGYPDYPGLSKEDNSTIFFFKDTEKDKTPFVIVAKFLKESVVRKQLTENGLFLNNEGDYTFISTDSTIFERIKNKRLLIDFNKQSINTDIKLKIYISGFHSKIESSKEGLLSDLTLKNFFPFFTRFFEELKSVKSVAWGLNVDDQQMSIAQLIKALPKTELYKFLSQKVGDTSIDWARHVDAEDNALSYVSKLDTKSNKAYTDYLFKLIIEDAIASEKKTAPSVAKTKESKQRISETLKLLQKQYNKVQSESDGTIVYSAKGNGDFICMGGKNFKPSTLTEFSLFFVNTILPNFMDLSCLTLEGKVDEKFANYKGNTILRTDLITTKKEAVTNKIIESRTSTSHATASKGYFIMGNSQPMIEKAIDNISEKKSPKNNLSSLSRLEKNAFLSAALNMDQIIKASLEDLRKQTSQNNLAETIALLEKNPTSPITITGTMQNGSLGVDVEIPLNTIKSIIKTFSSINLNEVPEPSPEVNTAEKALVPQK